MQIVEHRHITSTDDIVPYFQDNGYAFLECGQGYYTEEAEVAVKIDEDYFTVKIVGEQCSSKQDRGDRLYWIEEIVSVTFEPTPKKVIIDSFNAGTLAQIAKLEESIVNLKKKLLTI